MLSYKIFQMHSYDLPYNHIAYLKDMIYLTNKIEIKHINLTISKTKNIF